MPSGRWTVLPLLMLTTLGSCNKSSGPNAPSQVNQNGEKIEIIDRTGKHWDVTHAVNNYGFKASDFQFGLGPFAISPILNPKMIEAGNPRYPDDHQTFLVMGAKLAGDPRAYPISTMSWYEVADEKFGDQFVAVAY